jgi:hypothetical protein
METGGRSGVTVMQHAAAVSVGQSQRQRQRLYSGVRMLIWFYLRSQFYSYSINIIYLVVIKGLKLALGH